MTDKPKQPRTVKLPFGIVLNRNTALIIGFASTAVGLYAGEIGGAAALIGGFLLAWTLKPPVERPYHYKTVKVKIYDDEGGKKDVPPS